MNHCAPFPSQVVCFLPHWQRRCKLNVSSCQVIPVPSLPNFILALWIFQLSWTVAFWTGPKQAGEWSFPVAPGMRPWVCSFPLPGAGGVLEGRALAAHTTSRLEQRPAGEGSSARAWGLHRADRRSRGVSPWGDEGRAVARCGGTADLPAVVEVRLVPVSAKCR